MVFDCIAIRKTKDRSSKEFVESNEERKELMAKCHLETGDGAEGTVNYILMKERNWPGINKMINFVVIALSRI